MIHPPDNRRHSLPTDLAFLLERIRRVLSHDLRTPLGTIANYASILEYQVGGVPDDIRTFAGRIRASSVRAAHMLSWTAEALAIAVRESRATQVDVNALLERVLAEQQLVARFVARPAEPVLVDADLVSFAWRSFLAALSEESGGRSLDLDLDVRHATDSCILELRVGPRETDHPELVGIASFAPGTSGSETSAVLGLALAEDLLRGRGGGIELWGRPGASAGLRLCVPASG